MVVTLWARLPLLEPPCVLKIGKTWQSYGPNMVQLKSDVMKITIYRTRTLSGLSPAFCTKNKQKDYSEYIIK